MKKIELIGEIGTNHNGDFNEAIKLIDLAKSADFDTVKLQIYKATDIVSPLVKASFYGVSSKYKYWKDCIDNQLITPTDWIEELVSYCVDVGINLIATAHSIEGAEICLKYGIKRLKVASMDCNYYPLLKQLSMLNVPILLSTGMADKFEIIKAVDILGEKNTDLSLFHCTATYPTKYDEANLEFFKFLSSLHPTRLGLSDHSENNDLVLMSIPYGVSVVEKHITSDKSQTGPDHSFALDYAGMIDLRTKVNNGLLALGSGNKDLSKRELENRIKYRRKPILIRDKKEGETLLKDDIYFARPEEIFNDIIEIDHCDQYIGREFKMNVPSDKVLRKVFLV